MRDIYDSAETHYLPGSLSDAGVMLIRARSGQGPDTPYREIYVDETLGWSGIAPDIEIIDVEGGHSSMLQEPFVASLAAVLGPRLMNDDRSSTSSAEILGIGASWASARRAPISDSASSAANMAL